jgi:hypothetical protein
MKKTIAIVHFNTPELTTAGIKSIRKKGGMDWKVVVFDNSNARPFIITEPLGDVIIIDNTKGQYIDFDAELAKFPNKCSYLSTFASAKHMMSVQKLWELLPHGFILMESDVILSQPIDFMWDEQYAAVGKIQHFDGTGRLEPDRLLPMLCYMNVPKLVANGAKYFDPVRNFGLHSDDEKDPLNWYDTGASLLEDIKNTKPALVARVYWNLYDYFSHYGHGSWKKNNETENQQYWIECHWQDWMLTDEEKAQLAAIKPTPLLSERPAEKPLDVAAGKNESKPKTRKHTNSKAKK